MADNIGSMTDNFGRTLNINMDVKAFHAKLLAATKVDPLTVTNPEADKDIEKIRIILEGIKSPLLDQLEGIGDEVKEVVEHIKKSTSSETKTKERMATKIRTKKPSVGDVASGKDVKMAGKDFAKNSTDQVTKSIADASKAAKPALKYSILNEVVNVGKKVAQTFGEAMNVNVLDVFDGIMGGIKASVDQRMMLFSIEGKNAKDIKETYFGTEDQRNQFAPRTGMKSEDVQAQLNKEFQKGFVLQQKGNKLEKITEAQRRNFLVSSIRTGTVLGVSADEITSTFTDFNHTLGISSKELSVVGRSLESTALNTGVTGKNLMQAVASTQEIAKNIQQFAGLSGKAMSGLVEANVVAKKYGVDKQMNEIMGALSQGLDSLSKTAPELIPIFQRTADKMKIPFQQLDEVLQDPDLFKQFTGNMADTMSQQLKELSGGKLSGNLATVVDELKAMGEEGAILRNTINNVFKPFGGAGGLQQFGKAATELRKTDDDRLKEAKGNLDKANAEGAADGVKKNLQNKLTAIQDKMNANVVDNFNALLEKTGGDRKKALDLYNKTVKDPSKMLDEGKLAKSSTDYVQSLFKRASEVGIDAKAVAGGTSDELAKSLTSGGATSDATQEQIKALEDQIRIKERASQDPTVAVNQQIIDWQSKLFNKVQEFYDKYVGEWTAWTAAFWPFTVKLLTALGTLALINGALKALGLGGGLGGIGGMLGRGFMTVLKLSLPALIVGILGEIMASKIEEEDNKWVGKLASDKQRIAGGNATPEEQNNEVFRNLNKIQNPEERIKEAEKVIAEKREVHRKAKEQNIDSHGEFGLGLSRIGEWVGMETDTSRQKAIDDQVARDIGFAENAIREAQKQIEAKKAANPANAVGGGPGAVGGGAAANPQEPVVIGRAAIPLVTETNRLLGEILASLQDNQLEDDFMASLMDFSEQGQEKGSIYTHDIHAEKYLADVATSTAKVNDLGLFDKNNVTEAFDKDTTVKQLTDPIASIADLLTEKLYGGKPNTSMKNMGLFDGQAARDFNDDTESYVGNPFAAIGDMITGKNTSGSGRKKSQANTGSGLYYNDDNMYTKDMEGMESQKGGISTNLLSTDDAIESLIQKELATSDTDNNKVVSELKNLSDLMSNIDLLKAILVELKEMNKKKENVSVSINGGDRLGGSAEQPMSTNQRILKAIMRNPGWESLQDPVHSPSMNSQVGVSGGR